MRSFCFFVLALICHSTMWADNYPLTEAALAAKIAAKQQITDVPTIYIDIPSITNETELSAQLYKDRGTNVAPYLKATITVVDNSPEGSPQHLESFTDSDLEIKVRGNSTASVGNKKVPYRLKFASKKTSSDGKAHKHDLLGNGYAKRNWTLLANAGDKSMLRNALTYHLGQYVGMDFCPGYKFVDLVISGMYRGTYQVSDHCEVGANRVDVDEDTGWFLEMVEWTNMVEEPCITSGVPRMTNIKNPDTDDWTDEQINALKADIASWENDWYNAFFNASASSGWQAYNDVESMVSFITATELTGDLDGYFVMKGSLNPGEKFQWGPLWDKDLAYDNYSTVPQNKLVADYDKTSFEYVFKSSWKGNGLFANKLFLQLLKSKYDQLVDDGLYDKLCADIDRLAATVDNTQKQNYQKWNITSSEIGEAFLYPDYALHVQQLKDFLRDRIAFVGDEIDRLIAELPAPASGVYNPNNAWWGTGLSLNTNYNMSMVNRTLKGGQWNTFCLPFDATEAQMRASLGCSYQLRIHTGIDSDGQTMLFAPPSDLNISAGVPYLIMPASDVNSFGVFDDVVYSTNVNNGNNAYNGEGVTFDNVHYFYASLFCGYNLSSGTDYLFSNDIYADDNSLVKTSSNNQNGCRAFVRVTDGTMPVFKISDGEEINEDLPLLEYDASRYEASHVYFEHNGEVVSMKIINAEPVEAGKWNSICLPFYASEIVMEKAFGTDFQLKRLVNARYSADNGAVELLFGDAERDIEAGMPYLVKPSENVDELLFPKVYFMSSFAQDIAVGGIHFIGTLQPTTIETEDVCYSLVNGNEMVRQEKGNVIDGCSGYFSVAASAGEVNYITLYIDGETDGIHELRVSKPYQKGKVYNLQGQIVDRESENLPKGIYVLDGRKIVK